MNCIADIDPKKKTVGTARVSRLMRNQATCEKLRATTKAEALYAILTEPTASARAA